MTLLAAFQQLAPVPDDLPAEVRVQREEAGRIVFDALHHLAPRVLRGHADADDCVMTVLSRLLMAGPRGVRGADPQSDTQVESYLAAALRNHLRDLYRRRKDTISVDPGDPLGEFLINTSAAPVTPSSLPILELLLLDEQQALLEQASTLLYHEALPAAAAQSRDAATFRQTVLDIRDLARGTTSTDAIITREGMTPGKTAIDRLYKRHGRARATFLERLRDWLSAQTLPSDLDTVVRRLAEYDMASRVPRGGHPA